jgi:hypothetical protein
MNAALRAWRGFVRPFELLALLWAQPVARGQWLKLVVTQVSLTVVLGSVMFVRDVEQEREKEHERSPEVKRARRAQEEQALRGLEAHLRDAGLDTALAKLAGSDDVQRVLRELLDEATDGGVSDEAIGEKLAELRGALDDDAPGAVHAEVDDDRDDDAADDVEDGGARTTGVTPGTKTTFERGLASGLRAVLEATMRARRDGGVAVGAHLKNGAALPASSISSKVVAGATERAEGVHALDGGVVARVTQGAHLKKGAEGSSALRSALDGGAKPTSGQALVAGRVGDGGPLTSTVLAGETELTQGISALDGGVAVGANLKNGEALTAERVGDGGPLRSKVVAGETEHTQGAPALVRKGAAPVAGRVGDGGPLTSKVLAGATEHTEGISAFDGGVAVGANLKNGEERAEGTSALRSALDGGARPTSGEALVPDRVGDGRPGARTALARGTDHAPSAPALRAALDGGVAGSTSGPDDDDDETPAPDSRPLWYRRLVLWASSLVLVQSVLLAFTRDHQDRVAYHLSLLAGVQPEDVPGELKLRLDLKWLWRKLRRRIRGALVLAAGVATLLPVLFVALVLGQKDLVFTAVVSVVSGYWWVVFTAARSARAWRGEDDPTPPRPLRFALELSRRWRWLRWFGVPWLVRFAVWASKSMAAPARNIERDLPRFVGLALARVLATLPVVRLVLRAPLIVAAGEALEATADPEVQPASPDEPDQSPPA